MFNSSNTQFQVSQQHHQSMQKFLQQQIGGGGKQTKKQIKALSKVKGAASGLNIAGAYQTQPALGGS